VTFGVPLGTADDETLRAHLELAEVPSLLMTVAHLTADPSILGRVERQNGWLFQPQGGLSGQQQAMVRAAAFDALRRYRDAGSPPVPPPEAGLLRTISAWALDADTAELVPLLAEEIVTAGADAKAPRWTLDEVAPGVEFDVAIIGAGMSGLLAAHRLSQAGVRCTVYEKNTDVGGTWLENRYPGCRVDVASHLYSYSFAPKHDWPDHFCTRDVLHEYFRDVAGRFGLYDRIEFGTEVVSAHWDDAAARWRLHLRTERGDSWVEANAVISAVGQLNRPNLPDIPGRESFAGPAFHSAEWDGAVDLTGRRVAVVGTGSSAYQLVPEVAKVAAELLVFQRNAPWLRPTPHYHDPVPPGVRWLYDHVPYYSQWHRFWLCAPGLLERGGVLEGWIVDRDYPPTERAISAANDRLRAALTAWMSAQVADAPELLPKIIPGYPVGAKRVMRDNGVWLRTLRRPHVHLVCDPIDRITPTGLVAADGRRHDVDAIVYATGFQASRFLTPMTVTGRRGVDLHEMWAGDARAYLGITVPGFPNLFCLYGPNTNLSGQGGSIFYFSECGMTYVLDAIRQVLERGKNALDVRAGVHDDYNELVDQGNAERAWGYSSVSSWFINEKGRTAQNWPFSAVEYWRRTHALDPAEYEFL
jgi:4-hydroxyacetophenone monooxygenase